VADLQGLIFFVQRSMSVYMVFIVAISADAFLEASHDYYLTSENSKNRPLKGFIQVGKIIVYAICAIIIISILLEQKPGVLLGGLGAMSAVLLLVFKDSILGFVAGIQLTANNMVKIGDWITLPKHDIDGTVSEISLTTVKVQNFDRTTSTLPAYTLVSDSVKNWRGMEESGGRRITRSIFIDVNSVKFCTPEMLETFEKVDYITDYVKDTQAEIDLFNTENLVNDSMLVNGRRQTNLGVFRAYLKAYLKNNPDIKKDMTYLVRHLAPTEKGLPIQIYCFTSTTDWEKYENIQADIFDHVLAVIPFFDLKTFQSPSGADFKVALSTT
jgi:miniconductance mechanosensitive channel